MILSGVDGQPEIGHHTFSVTYFGDCFQMSSEITAVQE